MSTHGVTKTTQSNKYITKLQNIQMTRVNRSQLLLKSIASKHPLQKKIKNNNNKKKKKKKYWRWSSK